jgi:hypothetical protein
MTVARTATYRMPITVTVRVTAPGGIPACGATVTLQAHEPDGAGATGNAAAGKAVPAGRVGGVSRVWRTAARVLARDDGTAVTKVTVGRRTFVRALVTGAAWLPPATSAEVEVRPIPVLRVTPRRTGNRVLFREIPLSDQAGRNIITPPIVRMTSDGRSYTYGYDQRLSDLYLIEGLK